METRDSSPNQLESITHVLCPPAFLARGRPRPDRPGGRWQPVGDRSPRPCDTPVYRYAMYRWDPAPYEIYYFHSEAIAEPAAALHKVIDEVFSR